MSYYIRHHAQADNDYAREASLGGRNRRAALDEGEVDSQVAPETWPDGGYITRTVDPTGSERVDPEAGNPLEDHYVLGELEEPGPTDPEGETVYNARAPYRLSNLGRYFALSELGNVYDPIMYPSSQEPDDWTQWLDLPEEEAEIGEPGPGNPASAQGGGNTLRIGRPEHPRLAELPARQLLDLLHVGVNGTNLQLPEGEDFHPRTHLYPPTARDAEEAAAHPHAELYGEHLHAESPFELVRGRLNVNTATVGSLRMLLEGVLTADAGYGDEQGLDERHPIQALAKDIYDNAPYLALSQLAEVFSEHPPLFRGDASQNPAEEKAIDSPLYPVSDAAREEAFARCLNLGQLGSRHFRIVVAGDYVPRRQSGKSAQLATVQKVYEVFLRPIHNHETGELVEVRCEVLSVRDR